MFNSWKFESTVISTAMCINIIIVDVSFRYNYEYNLSFLDAK